MEQESFEVQVKVKLGDKPAVLEALHSADLELVRYRHYGQHDTYFAFDDPGQGRLRYREDDFMDETGRVTSTRRRLTLLGIKREHKFERDVLLSRSRFLAPATQSLRFYREYFRPRSETSIAKDRERWLIKFRNTEFFVNLDDMRDPALGSFVELKSRTWSRRDAEQKAALSTELLDVLGLGSSQTVSTDYIDVVDMSA
jgi:5-methylthioadenosine/S-adenosylhomocysteine deaminase